MVGDDMDNNSPLTLQYQLKKELYEKIASKEWLPGQMIPSEKELCDAHGVSRITVREALKELVQSGYLVRKQGKGTFVAAPTVEYTLNSTFSLSKALEERGMDSKFTILSYIIEKPSTSLRRTFRIEADEKVVCVTRLRTINGEAYAYEEAIVPERYLLGATQEVVDRRGLYPTIKSCSGLFPETAEESVEATICPDEVASAMGLKGNPAVFRIKRYTMVKDECVEFCKSYVYGQRYNCRHVIRQR